MQSWVQSPHLFLVVVLFLFPQAYRLLRLFDVLFLFSFFLYIKQRDPSGFVAFKRRGESSNDDRDTPTTFSCYHYYLYGVFFKCTVAAFGLHNLLTVSKLEGTQQQLVINEFQKVRAKASYRWPIAPKRSLVGAVRNYFYYTGGL